MSNDQLVDAFVARFASTGQPRLPASEVPASLRADAPDAFDFAGWKFRRIDSAPWLEEILPRLPRAFTPSFRSLVFRYAFPAFEIGQLRLFANTGEPVYDELSRRIFVDPVISVVLLGNGYVQIGSPAGGSYDPICLDMNVRRAGGEFPLVRLDHEIALQHERIRIKERIADSFVDLLQA